jgi:D-alanyl-lipoteichoic acid acyltransferase DltB (MBOAT superfamily)
MFFDTPIYIVFLTLTVLVYWRLSHRNQNRFLLAASYFFYGWWDWRFLTLILTSTVVDFFCARSIARSDDTLRRRSLLVLSLAVNLSFLGFFKYCNFFVDSFASVLTTLGVHNVDLPLLRIILPPGISFYTFQEVAYIVDVYHRKLKPVESLTDYALFISLFPHLIAGPIQRPSHLLPQVQQPREFQADRFFSGLMLILSGLFRKCVIADNCALLADAAFSGHLGGTSLPVLLIGGYAFAWQIYGDFSGYSDIARGSAQLMGFHFMVNFRQPYLARSLQEFWRRWHISLSTWLRDYLYIPLGGSRHGERKTYRNLMLTMLLGGLWHGANWTFVIWGGIHGAGLAIERWLRSIFRWKETSPEDGEVWSGWPARIFIFHLVVLGWIFFRAQSVTEAFHLLGGLPVLAWKPEYAAAFEFLAVWAILLFLLDVLLEFRGEEHPFEQSRIRFQMATACCLFFVITWFSANDVHAFIYFQF